MNPLIKWPGGKSGELEKINSLIPEFDRYIEPFFGGGALFFSLCPPRAAINDISASLIGFYRLIQTQDAELHRLLTGYDKSFQALQALCLRHYEEIRSVFSAASDGRADGAAVQERVEQIVGGFAGEIVSAFPEGLLTDRRGFLDALAAASAGKIRRTVSNHRKRPFSEEDLQKNLLTGFTAGYYTYFRGVFNDLQLGRVSSPSPQYDAAVFYFIREYCYGSMFRYNDDGEFNIPYGGMSYNGKNLGAKIDRMFCSEVEALFQNTRIENADFERFLLDSALTERDFMFLDPPYDTDFSDYEGRDFTRRDQERLAGVLRDTRARFILVIKNTPFIQSLYEGVFPILSFDNQYTYNVRSRNDRSVEHLIITNLPIA